MSGRVKMPPSAGDHSQPEHDPDLTDTRFSWVTATGAEGDAMWCGWSTRRLDMTRHGPTYHPQAPPRPPKAKPRGNHLTG
jgi:hypothetical protein